MFSGVPNGPLRLSPPQVHAAVHNSGVTILTRDSEGRIPSPPFSVVIVPPAPVPSGLQKKSGDGQVVAENTSFSAPLVVTDFVSTVPQEGESLTVTTSPSGVASCVAAGLIDTQGLGTINCTALSVAETTVVQISVSDSLGQSLAHPFNATVTDTSTPTSGLTKVSGDSQTVVQNTSFAQPLVVSKRLGGVPQSGVPLTISTSPPGVLSCTTNNISTDINGLASISCSALSVSSITTAQIFVSDDQGDSLDQPFSATILPFVPTDEGLTKVSGDEQIVPQNGSLPAPLVVSAVLNGTPSTQPAAHRHQFQRIRTVLPGQRVYEHQRTGVDFVQRWPGCHGGLDSCHSAGRLESLGHILRHGCSNEPGRCEEHPRLERPKHRRTGWRDAAGPDQGEGARRGVYAGHRSGRILFLDERRYV